MKFDIVKIANIIIYLLDKKVAHLNDKKLCVMLFLMEYNHQKNCGQKMFGEEYIKEKRNPEPKILSEIFDVIANGEDLEEEDERLYIIQELLDYIDIEVLEKDKFIELKFLKMEESFDESLFSADEFKTIHRIIKRCAEMTSRKIANECFQIKEVRDTTVGQVIL